MKSKQLGILIGVLLIFDPSAFARRSRNFDNVVRVHMQRDRNHWMVGIDCRISGADKPHICVIDSGASHTMISDKIVKPEGPLIDVTTANGVIHAHARHVSFTITDSLHLDSLALVQSQMTPPDIEILLGQDVLRQFRSVIFDYEKEEVEFHR